MKENILSLEDQIFENHYNYYKNVGIETIKINSGQIDQVSADYQGRVLYELLQNAFDKADKNILVQVKDNSLYVANDGEKFTFNANHDYKNGSSEIGIFKRYDFQSICSISTSTKNVSESIGNKGVGFKSVFSIADYTNIYTKGKLINNRENIDETISFRLYDSFKDLEKIPIEFEESIRIKIKENLIAIQKEDNLKNRGVPGYYYPLHITNEGELYVSKLLKDGYVTIIEIPFSDIDKVRQLFDEIKNIHFQFVQLKHNKNFEIKFDFNGVIYIKKVEDFDSNFFSANANAEIINLAKLAGITIDKPKVAIYIKDTPEGKLYNYLPTKVPSPFKYVDFHADFHTKVDRTDVNFDKNTTIGKYNTVLLRACVELYFFVLNSYIDDFTKINCIYINKNIKKIKLNQFNWNIIELKDSKPIYDCSRQILGISEWCFGNASIFFSKIADKYFREEKNIDEHDLFFNNICDLINRLTDDSYKQYKRSEIFKRTLGEELLKLGACIIPNLRFEHDTELIFRKKSDKIDSSITLPNFLGINITEFEISDEYFRKEGLKIKDFNDFNELLKYYKQCSFSGDYKKQAYSEDQQKELIKSLYQIFETKKDQTFFITHRFNRAYNSTLRENNSIINQANFNISTIFLKTNNQKYKPAQLCTFDELDLDFFVEIIPKNKENDFLRFLGVSTRSKYIFTDIRLFNKLKSGIDFIPALSDRKEEKIDESLIKNFYIITPEGKQIHPALVNDNNYRFLETLSNQYIKDELENLKVKKYNDFPTSYRDILFERMATNFSNKNEIIRLYQSVFSLFDDSKQYLIIENDILSWSSTTDFIILKNKFDFDLFTQFHAIKLLCYYSGSDIPEYLEKNIITPKNGKINYTNQIINDDLKRMIEQKIIYLLISISYSKNSDKNYLDDNVDLSELQKRLTSLEIIDVDNLQQEILFNEKSTILSKVYAIDSNKSKLYLSTDSNFTHKAEGIAEYLFGNTSIKDLVELLIFHKDIFELEKSFNVLDLDIISKKWKLDYQTKWFEFQKIILKNIVEDYSQLSNNWYYYNKQTQSDILVKIERECGFSKFNEIIERAKIIFEGYFDNFKLEIDENIYFDQIALFETFLISKNNEDARQILEQIRGNKYKLGIDDFIKSIESQIELKFSDYKSFDNPEKVEINKRELIVNDKIDNIFQQMESANTKVIKETSYLGGSSRQEIINHNSTKKIFKTGIDGKTTEIDYEEIGATGEIEVLNYYINIFLAYSSEDKKKGIDEIYEVIKSKIGNDSLLKYKENCISVIEDNEKLQKSLIPFFYITMHYKFSSFDLIGYKDSKPILVEVKTTHSENNNNFFISIAEVNIATGNIDYEIVRVTPSSIHFIGNPIKMVEDKITAIKADTFSLIPRNYEFNARN